MGRTNPTFRMQLERFEQDWQPFRRALRAEHQEDFDRLFDRANAHASAATYQNPVDPAMAAFMAMLLAQERELRVLRDRLEASEH